MVISRLHRPLSLTLATLGLITLVACGGGGGGSNPPPVAIDDTTPNAFSFTAAEGAEPNAVITSPTATISGINTATPISISGGEYSIAGGAFTSTAGTISNGQTLTVRVTASDKTNTPKEATISVGGVSAKFVVTTLADTTPDAFAFTAKTDVAVNSEHTSEVVAINGIDIAVPVSITGGLYSINGAEFTSAIGTVSAGQTIAVKTTASNITDTIQSAVLSVGSTSSTFAVTTVPDTTPPIAEFKFPTPYTMSEANSVKVRGTATDDHAITSVKVVVRSYNLDAPTVTLSTETIDVTPKAAGDYSSWTADISLTALAENEVKVIAMDDRENVIQVSDANKVVIRQADVASAFPDEVNQMFWLGSHMVVDYQSGRRRVLAGDSDLRQILAVDLTTGERSEVFSIDSQLCSTASTTGLVVDPHTQYLYVLCQHSSISVLLEYDLVRGELVGRYNLELGSYVYGMALDRTNERNQLVLLTYVFEWEAPAKDGALFGFNLSTKTLSEISGLGKGAEILQSRHITVDADRNRYLVTTGVDQPEDDAHRIIAIDASTGNRSIFSSNDVGEGELFSGLLPSGWFASLYGIAAQPQYGRLLVNEAATGKVLSVDIETGNRVLFKDMSYVQSGVDVVFNSQDLILHPASDIAIINDNYRKSIVLLDTETREKVILSKSENEF